MWNKCTAEEAVTPEYWASATWTTDGVRCGQMVVMVWPEVMQLDRVWLGNDVAREVTRRDVVR